MGFYTNCKWNQLQMKPIANESLLSRSLRQHAETDSWELRCQCRSSLTGEFSLLVSFAFLTWPITTPLQFYLRKSRKNIFSIFVFFAFRNFPAGHRASFLRGLFASDPSSVFCISLIGGASPPNRYGTKHNVSRKLAKRNGGKKQAKIWKGLVGWTWVGLFQRVTWGIPGWGHQGMGIQTTNPS